MSGFVGPLDESWAGGISIGMNHPTVKMCALIAAFGLLTGMNATNCRNLPDPTNPGCETDGSTSISLTLTNDDGDILETGRIVFTVDNQGPFDVSCSNGCDGFALAFNAFGRFVMNISSPGYETQQRIVNVSSNDNCNPETEDLIVVMEPDDSVAAIAGAWRASTVFGIIDLRFDDDGTAVGAILYDRVVSGDGNIYVSYNGSPIRGAAGQQAAFQSVAEPTRSGDEFDFDGTVLGVPVGFIDAQFTLDFASLIGIQPGAQNQGIAVTWNRLGDIPLALQDPQ